MGPTNNEWVELVRQLRALGQLSQTALHRTWRNDLGLHPAAAGLLAELARRGECRITELAHRRMVDVSVISRQIAQLERVELVARRPDPGDRRVALVHATEHGLQTLDRWRCEQVDALREALDDWDEPAVREACATLGAINDQLRRSLTRTTEPAQNDLLEGAR
ncbi:MarR family winged helix-turn-helix transcriptional regulator [Streptoalloteichus hindustanus]|uniref:DNA-binding transcriptional regulator, MarR family n=1 Tax=Streptoalloteichus hindustanus TaxID=2017 RepID=A0A1M4UR84_STRHI|nr:MarR family winged helix-turn-helix transcriptional regulator [Streptoalloteichus hindustanus]SHE59157.1 DNA-binding transcriptional regulator, MarR family [Streptoalloteichus hindustanus]